MPTSVLLISLAVCVSIDLKLLRDIGGVSNPTVTTCLIAVAVVLHMFLALAVYCGGMLLLSRAIYLLRYRSAPSIFSSSFSPRPHYVGSPHPHRTPVAHTVLQFTAPPLQDVVPPTSSMSDVPAVVSYEFLNEDTDDPSPAVRLNALITGWPNDRGYFEAMVARGGEHPGPLPPAPPPPDQAQPQQIEEGNPLLQQEPLPQRELGVQRRRRRPRPPLEVDPAAPVQGLRGMPEEPAADPGAVPGPDQLPQEQGEEADPADEAVDAANGGGLAAPEPFRQPAEAVEDRDLILPPPVPYLDELRRGINVLFEEDELYPCVRRHGYQEPLWGYGQLITDLRDPRTRSPELSWDNHMRLPVRKEEARAEFAGLKTARAPEKPVRTKRKDATSYLVPANLANEANPTLHSLFPGLSFNHDTTWCSATPFRSAVLSGVRARIVNDISAGKRVLVVGDSMRCYDVDGYIWHNSTATTGMFAQSQENLNWVVRSAAEGRVYETATQPLPLLLNDYDEGIFMLPITLDLSELCLTALRLGMKRFHVVVPFSPQLANDDLGVIPNLGCIFCKPKGASSVVFTDSEGAGEGGTLSVARLTTYWTTSAVEVTEDFMYVAKRSYEVPGILTLTYSAAPKGTHVETTSLIADSEGPQNYSLLTVPLTTTRGWLTDRHHCEVVAISKSQLTNLLGQAEKQKEPNAFTMTATMEQLSPGMNKYLHYYFHSIPIRYNNHDALTKSIIAVARLNKYLASAEAAGAEPVTIADRFRFVALGKAEQYAIERRLTVYTPTNTVELTLRVKDLRPPLPHLSETSIAAITSQPPSPPSRENRARTTIAARETTPLLRPEPVFVRPVPEPVRAVAIEPPREPERVGAVFVSTTNISDQLLLGAATNHRTRFRQLDLDSITTAYVMGYEVYLTTDGTLQECLMHRPPRTLTYDQYDGLILEHNVILIRAGVCAYPRGRALSPDCKFSCVLVAETGDHYLVKTSLKYEEFISSALNRYVVFQYSGINRFLTMAKCSLRSVPSTLCFYRAAGYPQPEQLAAKDNACSSAKVRELCIYHGIVIVYDATLYLPRGWSPTNLKKAVFVTGTHAFECRLAPILRGIANFELTSADNWSIQTNGDLARPDCDPDALHLSKTEEGNQTREMWKLCESRLAATSDPRAQSVLEYLTYCSLSHLNLVSYFEMIDSRDSTTYHRGLKTHASYDLTAGRFLSDNKLYGCTFGWTGRRFVPIRWNRAERRYETATDYSGVILVTADEELITGGLIAGKHIPDLTTLLPQLSRLRIVLRDGVPGCGKTEGIINRHDRKLDVITTSTREARADYLRRMEGKLGIDTRRYRTVDSLLLHGSPRAETLYCDEGYMTHFGQLLLAGLISGTSRLEISGDTRQLPFISRCIGMQVRHHVPIPDERIPENNTYRLPSSMMARLRVVYPHITTTNKPHHAPRVIPITATPVLTAEYDLVLTFTQAEKADVGTYNRHHKVLTVHESQGGAADNVALIRTKYQSVPVYDNPAHIIVAVSRHRRRLDYYTIDPTDKCSRFLDMKATREEMSESTESTNIPLRHFESSRAPTPYLALAKTNYSSRLVLPISEWLATKANLVSEALEEFLIVNYKPNYTHLLEEPRFVATEEVQAILDGIYMRPDESRREAMLTRAEFPLPDVYHVNWCRLAMAMQRRKTREYLEPILVTPQPKPDSGALVETLVAINKRNENPPNINFVRPKGMADHIVDVFFDTFIDKRKFDRAKSLFCYNNLLTFGEWLGSRTTDQVKQMEGMKYLEGDPNKYASHLKPDHKPTFKNAHNEELSAGQILAVHHPYLSAYFTTPIRTFSKMLKYCLKRRYIVNDGYNRQQLDGIINHLLWDKNHFRFLEVDFSKFDKSQDELTLEMNCLLLSRFGVPEYVVEEWRACHVTTRLVFLKYGIKVQTLFQRKSGDVFTFLGNTITSMLALAYVYDLTKVYAAAFGGDDSLIITEGDVEIPDKTRLLGELFNLDAKIENFPGAEYFSSRFLIHSRGCWQFVPDPLKALFRLGRSNMYCDQHIREYATSYADNYAGYLCSDVRTKLAHATTIRYGKYFTNKEVRIDLLIDFMASLVADPSKFMSLFAGEDYLRRRPLPNDIRKEFKKNEMQLEAFVDEFFLVDTPGSD